jgi:lipopolysaccharide/colanic/teichoic acid biosynthesis glycosyltransferase
LNTQIVNSGIAVLFFYFIPYLTITPKIVLFIFLILSFALILIWRVKLSTHFGFRKKQRAILIGEGVEMRELYDEVNRNQRYALAFSTAIDLDIVGEKEIKDVFENARRETKPTFIVADFRNKKAAPLLPELYKCISENVRMIELHSLYTEIFDRVPLSHLRYDWFLENISPRAHLTYDILKRTMDFLISVPLGVISLLLYPFVFAAIKFDDGGHIFLLQDRVGKGNKIIRICKFRTMAEMLDGTKQVTRVGGLLRKTRIDELPQLWNVIRGDLSMIGPRPELPEYVKVYNEEIPYYNIRHIITPGLSGWAQIHMTKPPKFGLGYDETKTKLSYDLYYIKRRSVMLDVKIALLTIRTLLSRSGI